MDDAKKTPVEDTRTARVTAEEALAMHAAEGRPGKLPIAADQAAGHGPRPFSSAYSPGVAEPCLHIHRDPDARLRLHRQGQFRRRGVQWHGRRCGLGNLGALASKPVMEGQGRAVQALRRRQFDRS
jgi:malate dehydrogenase (oxaloacetate-decarboxylating)(NADP+)